MTLFRKGLFILALSCVWSGQLPRVAAASPSWFEKMGEAIQAPENQGEWLRLAESLLHLPSILTVDSTNENTIILSSWLAGLGTLGKAGYEIAKPLPDNTRTAKVVLWDAPKILCYAVSCAYDVMRTWDASKIAEKNSVEAKKLRGFKINQLVLLLIEMGMRLLVIANQGKALGMTYVSELANLVGIWRLLSRYVTYFVYTNQVAINVTLSNVHNDNADDDEATDEQALEELNEIVQALSQTEKPPAGQPQEQIPAPKVDHPAPAG